ncbi:MAG: ACT domain-containing protein [Spirochaetota bacterium]
MIVCKFSGNCVADAKRIKQTASLLHSDDRRHIAVVSAPGKRTPEDFKVTDMLYTCQREATAKLDYTASFEAVASRFREIADELGLSSDDLNGELERIRRDISLGASASHVASRGEFLTAKLTAEYLEWDFVDTEECIIFKLDGSLHERTYELLRDAFSSGRRCVVPGFYGSSMYGGIKTFPRGGSDITGAVVAKSLGANLYETWGATPGILMADEHLITRPETVGEITYQEVRELSSVGAGVLHEEVVAFLRPEGIPVQIKQFEDPHGKGTKVTASRDASRQPVVGVFGKTGYCRLYVGKLRLSKDPDYKLKIRTILKVHGIDPEFTSIGYDSISFYFRKEGLEGHQELIERIRKELSPDEIMTNETLAMIGIVGEGLYHTPGILAKVSAALAKEQIIVRYLNYGGSLLTCIIGVDEDEYFHALQVMYHTLSVQPLQEK